MCVHSSSVDNCVAFLVYTPMVDDESYFEIENICMSSGWATGGWLESDDTAVRIESTTMHMRCKLLLDQT